MWPYTRVFHFRHRTRHYSSRPVKLSKMRRAGRYLRPSGLRFRNRRILFSCQRTRQGFAPAEKCPSTGHPLYTLVLHFRIRCLIQFATRLIRALIVLLPHPTNDGQPALGITGYQSDICLQVYLDGSYHHSSIIQLSKVVAGRNPTCTSPCTSDSSFYAGVEPTLTVYRLITPNQTAVLSSTPIEGR